MGAARAPLQGDLQPCFGGAATCSRLPAVFVFGSHPVSGHGVRGARRCRLGASNVLGASMGTISLAGSTRCFFCPIHHLFALPRVRALNICPFPPQCFGSMPRRRSHNAMCGSFLSFLVRFVYLACYAPLLFFSTHMYMHVMPLARGQHIAAGGAPTGGRKSGCSCGRPTKPQE